MNMRLVKKTALLGAALASLLVTGCISQGTLVENPSALRAYQQAPTQARRLELAKSYARAINSNIKEKAVRPGLYADYALVLADMGRWDEANVMLNNEKASFPSNTRYIEVMKQQLMPAFVGNNATCFDTIDMRIFDSIQVVLTPQEEAARLALENDPEYQAGLKAAAKAEKEAAVKAKKAAKKQEKKAKAKAKKAADKQKAADKKAADKAKKQEQRAKEEAREEALKARAEEKKAAEKEKAEQKQQKDQEKRALQRAKADEQRAKADAKAAAEKQKAADKKAAEKAKKEQERLKAEERRAAEKARKAGTKAEKENEED